MPHTCHAVEGLLWRLCTPWSESEHNAAPVYTRMGSALLRAASWWNSTLLFFFITLEPRVE